MDELAKRFAELADRFGPQVADAALQAARMEAYSYLAGGIMWLLAALSIAFGGRKLWRLAVQDGWSDDWSVAGVILWVIAGFCAICGLWHFVDPWTWAAINSPELWIAKKAFKL